MEKKYDSTRLRLLRFEKLLTEQFCILHKNTVSCKFVYSECKNCSLKNILVVLSKRIHKKQASDSYCISAAVICITILMVSTSVYKCYLILKPYLLFFSVDNALQYYHITML